MNQQLHTDSRVHAARALLNESRRPEASQIEAARWWGRLEQALASVLDAIGEEPPF